MERGRLARAFHMEKRGRDARAPPRWTHEARSTRHEKPMILLESIIDGIADIKDHFGRTMLQLLGVILGAGSIAATYSPMNDFHAGRGRFLSDADVSSAARVVVLGSERAEEFFGSENPLGKTLTMNGTGYEVVGVMEEKYFSFDKKHNAMRWMNRQIYIPITTLVTRKGGSLEQGKISFMHARMRDIKKADAAVDEIKHILQREHGV